tara:strand:+ start:980 stop:3115 length:2136 start_codon:yes stop_codon:yes gene_type:complete
MHESDNDVTLKSMDRIRIQGFVERLIRVHADQLKFRIVWNSDIAKLGAAGAASIEDSTIYLSAGPYEKYDTAEDVYDVYSGIALHEAGHLQFTKPSPVKKSDPEATGYYLNLLEDERVEGFSDLQSPNYSWYTKVVKDLVLVKSPDWHSMLEDPKTALDTVISRWIRDWIRVPYLMQKEQLSWHPISGRSMDVELADIVYMSPVDDIYSSYTLALRVIEYIASLYKDMGLAVPPQYRHAGEDALPSPRKRVSVPQPSTGDSSGHGDSEYDESEKESGGDHESNDQPTSQSDDTSSSNEPSPGAGGEQDSTDNDASEESNDASACTDTIEKKSHSGDPTTDQAVKSKLTRVAEQESYDDAEGTRSEMEPPSTQSTSGLSRDEQRGITQSMKNCIPERAMQRDVALVPAGSLIDFSEKERAELRRILETQLTTTKLEDVVGVSRNLITRVPKLTPSDKRRYAQEYKEMKPHIAAFSRIFSVRQRQVDYYQNELTQGRLNRRALARGAYNDKLFRRRDTQEATGLDITMLLDESGSMTGDRIKTCRKVSILLANALEQVPNVNLSIYGHTTADSFGGRAQDCALSVYVERGQGDLTRLGTMEAQWSNLDGFAIQHVGQKALKSTATDKWLVVLSDGMPAGYEYGHPGGDQHTKGVVTQLEKQGLNVIGVGIQTQGVAKLYKNHAEFMNPRQLANDLKKLIKRIIRNSTEAGMVM